jgi:HAD superfamily hydrolase (TIGR01509 family)
MDGTLTQTNQLIYDSFNYIAKKYRNRTYSIPEINAMFGPPEEEALLAIVDRADLDSVMDDYLAFYRAHHRTTAHLYPGIIEVLQTVKRFGAKSALFTGKGRRTTMVTLEECGIGQYFDCVVTGNDVKQYKPSADGLRIIMGQMSLKPSEMLMVGDAVSDVAAAHEAGVPVAAVVWDSYGKDNVLKMDAEYVFHSVPEFHRWLTDRLSVRDGRE